MSQRRFAVVVAILLAGAVAPAAAQQASPQQVVAAFCREDALGARTAPRSYARVAGLVGWPLEPAWDHVVLVQGYEVGDAQPVAPGEVEVEVTYTVTGRVSAARKDAEAHLARRRFRLARGDDGWRLVGAPPPPHLFASRVDADALQRGLAGADGYLSQSGFVAAVLDAAGWPVAAETVAELLAGATYGPVAAPRPGDVAVFVDAGQPYHVGVVEAPGRVLSATLTAGVVRSTLPAFAGEVRYLRLRASDRSGAADSSSASGSRSRSGAASQRRATTDSSSAPPPPSR